MLGRDRRTMAKCARPAASVSQKAMRRLVVNWQAMSFAPPLVRKEDLTIAEMERLARHIADFSLAGIERVRQTIEESAGKQR